MVFSLAVRSDVSKELVKEYNQILSKKDLPQLVEEFISYLDYTEETDSGREFHPITLGSCRVLMTRPLDMCLQELRLRLKEVPEMKAKV